MAKRSDSKPTLRGKVAVALRYRQDVDSAPTVVASGWGSLADRILSAAEGGHVPIHHDDPLARALGQVEISSTIPPELYQAVAEVISFVYRVQPATLRP